MTTTVAIVMSVLYRSLPLKRECSATPTTTATGISAKKKGRIEEEKEGVTTVDQKRDTQRQ